MIGLVEVLNLELVVLWVGVIGDREEVINMMPPGLT